MFTLFAESGGWKGAPISPEADSLLFYGYHFLLSAQAVEYRCHINNTRRLAVVGLAPCAIIQRYHLTEFIIACPVLRNAFKPSAMPGAVTPTSKTAHVP